MIISRERVFSSQREVMVGVIVFLMTALFFISLSVFATTIGTNMDATGTIGAATSTPWGDLAVDQVAGKSALRPVFVVGDNGTTTAAIFVTQKGVVSFGSTTPTGLLRNLGDVVIGRNGVTNDLYVSGGLGIGNATTTDNGFVIGADLFTVYANGNIGMFGTSSPVVIDGLSLGGAAGTHADLYVSGGLGVGNATTTDSAFEVGANFAVYGSGDVLIGGTTTAQGFGVKKADTIFSSGANATTTLSIITESTTKAGCIELTSSKGNLFRLYVVDETGSSSLMVQAGSCQGH